MRFFFNHRNIIGRGQPRHPRTGFISKNANQARQAPRPDSGAQFLQGGMVNQRRASRIGFLHRRTRAPRPIFQYV